MLPALVVATKRRVADRAMRSEIATLDRLLLWVRSIIFCVWGKLERRKLLEKTQFLFVSDDHHFMRNLIVRVSQHKLPALGHRAIYNREVAVEQLLHLWIPLLASLIDSLSEPVDLAVEFSLFR